MVIETYNNGKEGKNEHEHATTIKPSDSFTDDGMRGFAVLK